MCIRDRVHSVRNVFSANPEPRAMAKQAYRSGPLKILLRSYIMVSFSSLRLSFCDKHVFYNQCRLLTNDKKITVWPSCELESLLNEFTKLTMTAVSRGITCVLVQCESQTTRQSHVKVIHSVWGWYQSGHSILKVTVTLQKKLKKLISEILNPLWNHFRQMKSLNMDGPSIYLSRFIFQVAFLAEWIVEFLKKLRSRVGDEVKSKIGIPQIEKSQVTATAKRLRSWCFKR